jgi:manganese transport protein
LRQAHQLLAPLLGSSVAPVLFAVALLCAGQASTITGTLAGQIVMEGFLRVRMRPWLRRLVSRGLAIIPAVAVILIEGERGVDELLVLSQVVLSLQLAFAVVPLVTFTSDRRRMGHFANSWWVQALAVIATVLIIALNGKLAWDAIHGWMGASAGAWWVVALVIPLAVAMALMLLYMVATPLLNRPWAEREPEPVRAPSAGAAVRATRASGLVLEPEPLRWHSGSYRRIAVAVELADADDNILYFLRRAQLAPESELVFVHVAESAASRWLGEQSLDSESREDMAALEALAQEFTERGTRSSVRLGHGDPAREIARIVREERSDLLVTGSHGHTGLSDMVFGATISSVRHLVTCPILTVPPRRPR